MHFCQLPALFPQITEELLNNIFRDLPFLDNTTAIDHQRSIVFPKNSRIGLPISFAIIFV